MNTTIGSRIKRAWNVFRDKTPPLPYPGGYGFTVRPDRVRLSGGSEKCIINSIINRIAVDAASVDIWHVHLDENGRYKDTIDSGLNNCLTLSANIDQTGRAFIQDAVESLLGEGCIAMVPVDFDDEANDPDGVEALSIDTMRVGKIIEWFPKMVRVELFNEELGRKQEILLPKDTIGIVENPLYSVMNEHNSTMQRLIRKLNILDSIDEQSSSGKLDLIIQLPYVIKTEARRRQADERRKEIERQLSGSKYGIAYADGTERITQLNRSVENNLMNQIEYLTNMLFSQIGMTQGILDGTANEETMLNYYNRIVEPILTAIVDELRRKFLTDDARAKRQSVEFFQDPLKLIPISQLAEIGDKLIRNEILSANEIRQKIGVKPSADPKADELRNPNLSAPKGGNAVTTVAPPNEEAEVNKNNFHKEVNSQNE